MGALTGTAHTHSWCLAVGWCDVLSHLQAPSTGALGGVETQAVRQEPREEGACLEALLGAGGHLQEGPAYRGRLQHRPSTINMFERPDHTHTHAPHSRAHPYTTANVCIVSTRKRMDEAVIDPPGVPAGGHAGGGAPKPGGGGAPPGGIPGGGGIIPPANIGQSTQVRLITKQIHMHFDTALLKPKEGWDTLAVKAAHPVGRGGAVLQAVAGTFRVHGCSANAALWLQLGPVLSTKAVPTRCT